MELVRALAAAALVLGPLAWLHRRSTLPAGWHPLLVCCAAMLVVLLGGVAGQLDLAVVLLALAAAGLLAREAVAHRGTLLATLREPATVVLGATAVVVAVLVHGEVFTHYDNFSHWAMVWQVMLEQHALPGPEDDVVAFTTYPLGGASFAYLVSRLVGTSEWVPMWGQSLFLAACALPVVSAAGARRLVGVLLYAVGTLVLLTHVTAPTSLLVDALIAGLGAALLMLVLLEREAVLAQPWAFGVVAVALVVVKNSGMLFIVVGTVLALMLLVSRRATIGRRGWLAWGVNLALPWVVWWVWGQHVSATFPDAGEAKHSVSLDRFGSIFGEKTPEDVRAILGDLWQATVTDVRLWLLLAGLVVASALAVHTRALSARDQRRLLVTVVATVVLWEVSLGLMYLLSMPLGEALNLAGFPRYQGTIHVVVALVVLTLLARCAAGPPAVGGRAGDRRTRRYDGTLVGPVLVGTLCLAVTLPLVHPPVLLPRDAETRHGLERALAPVEFSPDDLVCLLLEAPDKGYRGWITRYVTQHGQVTTMVVAEDATALPKRAASCDVFVLADPRPHTAEVLADAGLPVPSDPLPQVVGP